jgi:hypothetical protein
MRRACRDQIAVWTGVGSGGLGGRLRRDALGTGRETLVVAASIATAQASTQKEPAREMRHRTIA